MKLEDFKIGDKFYTATGAWIVSDIGTRTVVAYNASTQPDKGACWDLQDNIVFYEYDFGGCSLDNRF